MIWLKTKNCIVTGKPAKQWCGYVKLDWLNMEVHVIAGFADDETFMAAKTVSGPCYGDFKIEHGLLVEDRDWIDGKSACRYIETGEIK